MYRFHVAIHAAPSPLPPAHRRPVGSAQLAVLMLQPADLTKGLPTSFEQALAALEQLPRMFIELDGSFVWVGGEGSSAWQVDGLLFDRAGHLMYVELKGSCPVERFDELLTACGWPASQLVFQLIRAALFLDEASFRAWASPP